MYELLFLVLSSTISALNPNMITDYEPKEIEVSKKFETLDACNTAKEAAAGALIFDASNEGTGSDLVYTSLVIGICLPVTSVEPTEPITP